jgi:hypothetical protein
MGKLTAICIIIKLLSHPLAVPGDNANLNRCVNEHCYFGSIFALENNL